jgi:hypothetical protein
VADTQVDGLVGVGISLIPGGGIAQKVWNVVRPPNAQQRFENASQEYDDELGVRLVDAIRALQADVQRHGAEFDKLAPLRALAIAQQVATSASEASGEPKVEAVLNAGARQFDPRRGPQETRKHWLDRVTRLSDLEIRVLLMLKERGPLFYFATPGWLHWGATPIPADLPEEDRVALGSVLLELRGFGELVTDSPATLTERNYSARACVLSQQGEIVVRFIEPIAGG